MRTAADEALFDAKQDLAAAIYQISRIVVEEVWGTDEYQSKAATHKEALDHLLAAREALNR